MLGGRTRSFTDPASGLLLDNCQHVILGCCSEAIGFLRRIGSLHQVEFHDTINLVRAPAAVAADPGAGKGPRMAIEASWLPAPFHLLPAIAKTAYLSGEDKFGLARVLAGMLARKPKKQERAADYLRSLGCLDGLLDRLIEPVIVSALNESAQDASASYARMVLVESLVKGKRSYRLGVPTSPHCELIEQAASRWLKDKGCEIRLSSRVGAIHAKDGMVRCIELSSGERMEFDMYVAAVPPSILRKLGVSAKGGKRLGWRPIVSAHLFFNEPTPAFEPACVAGEPFGWVFSKLPDVGYVQVVASAAEALAGLDKAEVLSLALRATRIAEPRLTSVPLHRGIVYRAANATFATLSCDDHRPPAATSTGNLFLAGDWTATGWPATIESAVRSGHNAARALIGAA